MLIQFLEKNWLYIVILLAVFIIINQIILIIGQSNIDTIYERVRDAETETEKQKEKLGELVRQGKNYKDENRELRVKLETLKEKECYKYFIDYSLFLDDYSEYNETFYLSNMEFYKTLSIYKSELDSYKRAIEKNLFKWTITPAILTNFKSFGVGIDLSIPVTSTYSIVGGIGYFNDIYFKIGLGIKL